MDTFFGLVGLVVYAAAVIALAAAVTWTVVKLLPADRKKSRESAS